MPTREVTTRPIVLHSIQQGKKVFVPYLYRSRTNEHPLARMDMVTLHSKEDYENFLPDKWGIPTPSKDSISSRIQCLGGHDEKIAEESEKLNKIDVIVMPGVAFDRNLQRLGHGKGFYDFFLAQYLDRVSSDKTTPFLGKKYKIWPKF